MEHPPTQNPEDPLSPPPTPEELKAELLDIPAPADQPAPVDPPSYDQVLAVGLRYIRGKRGGDLLAVILVGSGARRSVTPHSDVDFIAVIKGEEEREEVIRIADRSVEIRYRGLKAIEMELPYAPRLPPLLRKGRVLFEFEGTGGRLVDQAAHRFRQGPPPLSMNEKIRLKAQCLHWIGKVEDVQNEPAAAQYLFGIFLEDLVGAFFRMRGFWLTSPVETVRFISSRDSVLGELLKQFLTVSNCQARLNLGRQMTDMLFKDTPNPPRVD